MMVIVIAHMNVMIPEDPMAAPYIRNVSIRITPNLKNAAYVPTLVILLNFKHGISKAVYFPNQCSWLAGIRQLKL